MSDLETAKKLFVHYIQQASSHGQWSSDSISEMESLIDNIVAASVTASVEAIKEEVAPQLEEVARFLAGRGQPAVGLIHASTMAADDVLGPKSVHDIAPTKFNIDPRDIRIVSDNGKFTCEQRLRGLGLKNLRSPVEYIGVFFGEDARRFLGKTILPRHERLFFDHVTLAYAPSEAMVNDFRADLGKSVVMRLMREYVDDRGQCVTVDLFMDKFLENLVAGNGRCPHVTVSCDKYTEPVYSNKLITDGDGERADDVDTKFFGRIGFALEDGTVDFGEEPETLRFSVAELKSFLDNMDKALKPDDDASEVNNSDFTVSVNVRGELGGFPRPDASDLRTLLQDAVGEFPNERSDAESYVDKRYKEMFDGRLGTTWRENKIAEVIKRCAWARSLRIAEIKKNR